MASLIELFPKCSGGQYVVDDVAVPTIDFECVAAQLVKTDRVIQTKADLDGADVTRYMEFDSGTVIVKIKGKGWFALAPDKPALKALARSLV